MRAWVQARVGLLLVLLIVGVGRGVAPTPGAQAPTDLYAAADALTLLPAPYFTGDVLSVRVTATNGGTRPLNRVQARVFHRMNGTDSVITDVTIPSIPAGGKGDATVEWAWDTGELAGPQTLLVQIDPDDRVKQGDENAANNVTQVTLYLQPERPAEEQGAQWAKSEIDCCVLHYITNTAVERDLAEIERAANAAVAHVEAALGVDLTTRFNVYLVPRTIGHGGYAAGWLLLSYHDRHYPAGTFREVLRHEVTHGAQRSWAGADSITMLGEGLAVWVTGGHFKPEPVRERAAALLQIERYIPFRELVNDFYQKQHEIGYLEAGGFVMFLAETYGQEQLRELFANLKRNRGERDYEILDRALNKAYGKGAAALEEEYLQWLRATPRDAVQERDLADTILYFDTVRRYQAALDPTAYFLSPWLPSVEEAEKRGRVADFIRHPESDVNLALETMFLAAAEAQRAGDFATMEELLASINLVLDQHQAQPGRTWAEAFTQPTAAMYLAAAQATTEAGYEPQRMLLGSDTAAVWATRGGATPLYRLTARRQGERWRIIEWVFKEAPWLARG